MKNIRTTLSEIMNDSIIPQYKKEKICNERHLQAEIYHQLKNKPHLSECMIWVEPVIKTKRKSRLYNKKPDLIISDEKSKEIVCVIELKFCPEGLPKYVPDIRKLKWFEESRSDEEFILDSSRLKLARDFINVYIIFSKLSSDVSEYMEGLDKNRYLLLHYTRKQKK